MDLELPGRREFSLEGIPALQLCQCLDGLGEVRAAGRAQQGKDEASCCCPPVLGLSFEI